jgi:hypothetical protein
LHLEESRVKWHLFTNSRSEPFYLSVCRPIQSGSKSGRNAKGQLTRE